METTIIILAAGASTRMGQSKQLMKVGEFSLLKNSVSVALQSGIGPVIVVLGALEVEHRKEIEKTAATIVSNPVWKNGMGSSLKVGLRRAQQLFRELENVIVMVCDQPHLSASILKNLHSKKLSTGKSIIASEYSGAGGVPALFSKVHFREILGLPDSDGAKKIIERHPTEAHLIDFPQGAIDLDTPEDYNAFTKSDT